MRSALVYVPGTPSPPPSIKSITNHIDPQVETKIDNAETRIDTTTAACQDDDAQYHVAREESSIRAGFKMTYF